MIRKGTCSACQAARAVIILHGIVICWPRGNYASGISFCGEKWACSQYFSNVPVSRLLKGKQKESCGHMITP